MAADLKVKSFESLLDPGRVSHIFPDFVTQSKTGKPAAAPAIDSYAKADKGGLESLQKGRGSAQPAPAAMSASADIALPAWIRYSRRG